MIDNGAPNPGSPEAVKLGCICPVLDNCHGKVAGLCATPGSSGLMQNVRYMGKRNDQPKSPIFNIGCHHEIRFNLLSQNAAQIYSHIRYTGRI